MEAHNFKNLRVWQASMELAGKIYTLTTLFPSDEKYGLTSQIRRSAVSIPLNIAEGSGRGSSKEFTHFLRIALSSAFELETQLLLTNQLKLVNNSEVTGCLATLGEVQKMLYALQKRFSDS